MVRLPYTHNLESNLTHKSLVAKLNRKWLFGAVLLLACWILIAWFAAQWLIVSEPLQHADAIVVLSGSSAYTERAQRAAQIYLQGVAPIVILTNDSEQSGWSSAEERNPFFYERARDELLRQGVPKSAIAILTQPVYSTYDEAVLLDDYAVQSRLQSLLIVTSGYHSRRALWTFRRVFGGTGKEIGVETPPPGLQTPRPISWWLHRRGWRSVAGEFVKIIYYRLTVP